MTERTEELQRLLAEEKDPTKRDALLSELWELNLEYQMDASERAWQVYREQKNAAAKAKPRRGTWRR